MTERRLLRLVVAMLVLVWIAVVPPPFAQLRVNADPLLTWWPVDADALVWWPDGLLILPWRS